MQGFGGLSKPLYPNHLFFVSDFVERILYPAQALGFEADETGAGAMW